MDGVHYKQGAINIIMVDDTPSRTKPYDRNNPFISDILRTIRAGETDYVFSIEQLDQVKARLRPNEKLEVVKNDYYYALNIKKGGSKNV